MNELDRVGPSREWVGLLEQNAIHADFWVIVGGCQHDEHYGMAQHKRPAECRGLWLGGHLDPFAPYAGHVLEQGGETTRNEMMAIVDSRHDGWLIMGDGPDSIRIPVSE